MKRILLVSIAGLSLIACGGGSPKLSLSARTPSTASALTLSNGITIDRVRMVVQQIKLEPTSSPDGGGDTDIAAGPYLIDLQGQALEGGVNKVFDLPVTAGEYKQIKFKVHKVEDADVQANSALSEMKGLSIRVEGSNNGKAFTFNSALDEEQEREGKFVIGQGDNNIALQVSPSGWFTASGGATLDPSDTQNQSQIESNIKASIDAFGDNNNDGKAD